METVPSFEMSEVLTKIRFSDTNLDYFRFNKLSEDGEDISGVNLWETDESLGVEGAINDIVEETGVVGLWESR